MKGFFGGFGGDLRSKAVMPGQSSLFYAELRKLVCDAGHPRPCRRDEEREWPGMYPAMTMGDGIL